MFTDLVVTLLGPGHHAAVLPGAVSHGDLLTPGVPHKLPGGAFYVLGSARRLLRISKFQNFYFFIYLLSSSGLKGYLKQS